MGGTIFAEHGLECPDIIGVTDGENWDLRIPLWVFLDYNLLLICLEPIQ